MSTNPIFPYALLVDKREPCGTPTPNEDVLLLVAIHAESSSNPLLIRVQGPQSVADQVWYKQDDIWYTQLVSKYTYPLNCPACHESNSWSDGVDSNGEICFHCCGAGII